MRPEVKENIRICFFLFNYCISVILFTTYSITGTDAPTELWKQCLGYENWKCDLNRFVNSEIKRSQDDKNIAKLYEKSHSLLADSKMNNHQHRHRPFEAWRCYSIEDYFSSAMNVIIGNNHRTTQTKWCKFSSIIELLFGLNDPRLQCSGATLQIWHCIFLCIHHAVNIKTVVNYSFMFLRCGSIVWCRAV